MFVELHERNREPAVLAGPRGTSLRMWDFVRQSFAIAVLVLEEMRRNSDAMWHKFISVSGHVVGSLQVTSTRRSDMPMRN